MRAVTELGLHSLMEVLGKADYVYVLFVTDGVPTTKNVVLALKENGMEVNEIPKKGWP